MDRCTLGPVSMNALVLSKIFMDASNLFTTFLLGILPRRLVVSWWISSGHFCGSLSTNTSKSLNLDTALAQRNKPAAISYEPAAFPCKDFHRFHSCWASSISSLVGSGCPNVSNDSAETSVTFLVTSLQWPHLSQTYLTSRFLLAASCADLRNYLEIWFEKKVHNSRLSVTFLKFSRHFRSHTPF